MMRQNASIKNTPRVARVFVEEALDCGRKAGVDIHRLLADLEINEDYLGRLDAEDFGRVWLELSIEMQDEFFGLGARPMRPGSTTLLGHAIRGAPSFDIALRRSLRFLKLVLDAPFGTVDIKGNDCSILVTDQMQPNTAFAYRAFFLILHGFNCWAANERIPIRSIAFPCAEPDGQTDYGDFFGVPVEFNAPQGVMVFDRRYLSRPMRRSEAELKIFLRSLPQAFLHGYRDRLGLKQKIVETCFSGLPEDWPNAVGVARSLGLSRSTLHRMLNREGLSLTQLKEEQRRNRATALLSRTDQPIAEIAAAVGYAEESAFYRAFHRWYGTTPNKMRAAALVGDQ